MSIKILGGVARGFTLNTPRSDSTRPTSVLVRRKIFDWRQNLEGKIFIDLCAGSGAMGFEALSRGAGKILLNDSQKPAFLTLKDNAARFSKAFKLPPEQVHISSLDALKWLSRELPYLLPETEEAIIFVDPPYEDHRLYEEILNFLKSVQFKGEVWVEADRLKGPSPDVIAGAFHSIIKKVEQGDHFVVIGFLV